MSSGDTALIVPAVVHSQIEDSLARHGNNYEVTEMPVVTQGTIDDNGKRSICRIEDVLAMQSVSRPDETALEFGDVCVSFTELYKRATEFATRLSAAGVRPGDRVPIYLDKGIEFVVAIYGAWFAGAVAIPLNDALIAGQVRFIVDNSGAKLLVSRKSRLRRARYSPVKDIQIIDVDTSNNVNPHFAIASEKSNYDSLATILYTSGSTGKPKGIMISHDNLIAGAEIVTRYLGIHSGDKLISVLPFGFDYGLNQLLGAVFTGATLVLQRSNLPADICRTLEEKQISVMAAVPPLWNQLSQRYSPFLQSPLPALRLITNTGGVFPIELVRTFRSAHPAMDIVLMYGLSEAFRSTYLPPEEAERRPGSIGIPIPQTELFVVDETGNCCPPGEVGELVHRGPTVALGYWQAPEATAATFRSCPALTGNDSERVVFSGDLVYQDTDGYFYFSGRRDQLIKCLGYRVSADEIEELLLSCELIEEAAVTTEPDAQRGSAIVAHIVPSSPDIDESELAAYARRAMPVYMRPVRFEFREDLPRTSSGKIDRTVL